MPAEPVLHLASASPRRRELLHSLGIEHSYAGVGIDESARKGEAARELVVRLARQKAAAAPASLTNGLPVLGADTVVVVDELVFGKPRTAEHAMQMLTTLSGRSHQVLTAIAVRMDEELHSDISTTLVRFRDILPGEARAYWQCGEPAGKAGAYAIQGYGGIFVHSIQGSYSGVVGLPVFETAALLRSAGISVLREVMST